MSFGHYGPVGQGAIIGLLVTLIGLIVAQEWFNVGVIIIAIYWTSWWATCVHNIGFSPNGGQSDG